VVIGHLRVVSSKNPDEGEGQVLVGYLLSFSS
jgi:hypothetical protein